MLSLRIEVLQEFLTGQLLARSYDLRDAPIAHGERPLFPAFADEAEADLRARDFDVPALERGQAVASVLPGVVVGLHADEGALQQMDDGCQDLLARAARAAPYARSRSP